MQIEIVTTETYQGTEIEIGRTRIGKFFWRIGQGFNCMVSPKEYQSQSIALASAKRQVTRWNAS